MKKRMKLKKRFSRKLFRNTASKVKGKNFKNTTVMRGGYRL